MDDAQLDWSSTHSSGNELRVALRGDVDHLWGEAFASQSQARQRETFGQTWDEVQWMGDALVIVGIDEDTSSQALRTYVEQLVSATNNSAARNRARLEAEAENEAGRQDRRDEHASLLADELRRADQ